MATLNIKGVPDELLAQLKREAAQNRRSLNGEVIHRLEGAAAPRRRDAQALLRDLDEHRIRLAGRLPAWEEIKAAIEEGRE